MTVNADDTSYISSLQVVGWPGQRLSIPIEMIDEANQPASGFIQLEPVDSNKQVNIITDTQQQMLLRIMYSQRPGTKFSQHCCITRAVA